MAEKEEVHTFVTSSNGFPFNLMEVGHPYITGSFILAGRGVILHWGQGDTERSIYPGNCMYNGMHGMCILLEGAS